jgi:NAD(P)-dependent dehydrogenase (short-subunit alcohol dehydrogenase family)
MPLPERPNAVITGASSGLGRALARELAGRRAKILMADIDEEGAKETAQMIEKAGGKASFVRCDVSRVEDVMGLSEEAFRAFGHVDLLVNNAGVAVGGPIGTVPIDDWAWVMGINLWGVIYGCHAFIPRMKEQGGGAILNVASAAGLMSSPMLGPYNVTKAGVVALSETLFGELAPDRISVTVLCPTFFKTNIAGKGRTHGADMGPERIEKLMARSPIQAEGVARAAIEAVEAGQLYAVPHPDGRWFWRLKRASPELFYAKVLPEMRRRVRG